MKEVVERLRTTWPEAKVDEVVCIAPIGSRGDILLYWRPRRRVTTGRRGKAPCFEGSLEEFRDKVESDYRHRLIARDSLRYDVRRATERHWSEYRAAIAFFLSLETDVSSPDHESWVA